MRRRGASVCRNDQQGRYGVTPSPSINRPPKSTSNRSLPRLPLGSAGVRSGAADRLCPQREESCQAPESIPGKGPGRSIQNELRKFLDGQTRKNINLLENLAPEATGNWRGVTRKTANTLYPNTPNGDWTFPAGPDAFSAAEVSKFQELSNRNPLRKGLCSRGLRQGTGLKKTANANQRRDISPQSRHYVSIRPQAQPTYP